MSPDFKLLRNAAAPVHEVANNPAGFDFFPAFQYWPQSRAVSYIAKTFSIGTRAWTLWIELKT